MSKFGGNSLILVENSLISCIMINIPIINALAPQMVLLVKIKMMEETENAKESISGSCTVASYNDALWLYKSH
jgi:hypothetical protein